MALEGPDDALDLARRQQRLRLAASEAEEAKAAADLLVGIGGAAGSPHLSELVHMSFEGREDGLGEPDVALAKYGKPLERSCGRRVYHHGRRGRTGRVEATEGGGECIGIGAGRVRQRRVGLL